MSQNPLIGSWIKGSLQHKIAETYSQKRIGEYDKVDMEALVNAMAKWSLLLGVTQKVTSGELTVICQFVYDNWKHYTITDVETAMNMAISHKFDIGFVSQKIFSAYYVSRCFSSYEDYKRGIVNEIYQQKEIWENQQEVKVTPQQKMQRHREHITMIYRDFKATGVVNDIGDICYLWLRDKAKALRLTTVLKNEAKDYAKQRMVTDKIQAGAAGESVGAFLKNYNEEKKMQKYVREYVLMKFFEATSLTNVLYLIKIEDFQ
jgi:hypothetical protein